MDEKGASEKQRLRCDYTTTMERRKKISVDRPVIVLKIHSLMKDHDKHTSLKSTCAVLKVVKDRLPNSVVDANFDT